MKASRISGQRPSWGRRLAAIGLVVAAAVLVLGLGARSSWKAGKGASQLGRMAPEPAAVLAQMPLSFEPNQGQTDPAVKFLARGAGYGLFLTSEEAVLKLQHSSRATQAIEVVRMKLAGANPTAWLQGTDPLPGKSNYLIGNDPSKWRSNIPHYARVGYRQVYPGIDLVYYGNRGRLEYDFQVAPGADPSTIQLTFAGEEKLNLNPNGDLILRTSTGDLRFNAPVAYQEENGKRRSVNSRFVLAADNRVGFTVGDYDSNRALIIDPVLTYSSYLGGNGDESCAVITGTPVPGCPAIAVDSALNYYVAGSTTSTNFPTVTTSTSAPPFQAGLAAGAHANVFVAKFDINNTLQEATYIGGDGTDVTAGLAADAASNVYVAGTTTSTNFPTHNGFNAGATTGGTHAFLTVLAPDFTTPSYSTYIAGTGTDTASGLAIDGKGNAFISGITSSTDFPTTPTALQPASLSATDSQFFMTKVNTLATGSSSLLYSTYFGGGNPASGAIVKGGGIAVDSSGNAYITGGTNFLHVGNTLTDFPILNASQDCLGTPAVVPAPNPPPTCSASVTLPDAFVAKINPNAVGSAGLLYSTYLGGAGTDIGYAIALDSGLNVYLTGSSDSPAQYIPSGSTPLQSAPGGGLDAFVAKLNNPASTALVTPTYFTFLGGASTDVGMAISADTSGNARVTGWTAGGFPVHNPGPFPVGPGSGTHAFVARIDTTGSSTATALDFSSPFGGSGVDHGTGIAVDPNFTTYVVGDTSGGIPTAGSPEQPASGGATDAFVAKLGPVVSLSFNPTLSVPSAATVGVGNPATFKYVVTNNSPDPAGGVVFTDNLPTSGASFGSITSSPGTCGAPSGTTVVCSIGTLVNGGTATISVTLTPTSPSPTFSNSGTVSAIGSSTAVGFSEHVNVTDFALSASQPTPAAITAGQTATVNVTVTPVPTFPNTVSLSCSSGVPTNGSCAFSTTSVTTTNTSPASSTLTISTTARPVTTTSLRHARGWAYALFLPVSGIALFGAGAASRRRKWLLGMCLVAVLGLAVFQLACGSSSSSTPAATGGTPAGTYHIVINATSGSVTRQQTVTLQVQ